MDDRRWTRDDRRWTKDDGRGTKSSIVIAKRSSIFPRNILLSIIVSLALICVITTARAADICDDINAFSKDNPSAYAGLCQSIAGFYQQKSDFVKALAWVERALTAQPQNLALQFYKSQILYTLGRYPACEGLLEKLNSNPALKDSPLLVSVRMLLYQEYKATDKLAAKQKAVEKKLKAKKVDTDTYRQALLMLRASGSFDKIIDVAKKASKAFAQESSFRIALAYAYEAKGNTKAALKEYKSSSGKFPDNLIISSRIIELNIKDSRFKDAEAELNRVQKLYAKDPQVLTQVERYRAVIGQMKAK